MALYLAAMVIIALLAGGLIYTITYDCLNMIYTASLPSIALAGGLNANETLSTSLILNVFASIPVILFLVCWAYIVTKSQKPSPFDYG